VKLLRLTISSLMAVVLLVALDVWACKALLLRGPLFFPDPDLADLIVVGALPMANVLAIGLFTVLGSRHQHKRNRPGLVGFEVGGLAGLLVFLACSLSMTHSLHEGVGQGLRAIGLGPPGPGFLVCALTLLLAPQLALALLGGWLCRRYNIRVKTIVEPTAIPGPMRVREERKDGQEVDDPAQEGLRGVVEG
jgi:hypothetical protein